MDVARGALRRFGHLVIGMVAVGLAGCAAGPYDPSARPDLRAQVLGTETPVVDVDVLVLTPAMQIMLDTRVRPIELPREPLDAIQKMMFGEGALAIRYVAAATLNAAETFESRVGNCLPLTNLFVASARYVGLDAVYEVAQVRPTWDHAGQAMTDNMALARYYNNVAVGDLLEGELEAAREQLRVALHLDADYSDAWSNMGTVQRRLARPDLAEYSYLQALEVAPRNYTAMSNLALVLEARGSKGPFARAVGYYRQRNPYHQYQPC